MTKLRLGGMGDGIEIKRARAHGGEVLRADVIREAELFADAIEEAAAHVAAGFIDELQRVDVRVFESDGAEADDNDGLFFVEMLGEGRRSRFGLENASVGRAAGSARDFAQSLLNPSLL